MKKICGNCFSRISGNVCRKCGHVNVRTSAEYDALPVGTQLRGRYTVGKLMGRGGFGMIYLAYDRDIRCVPRKWHGVLRDGVRPRSFAEKLRRDQQRDLPGAGGLHSAEAAAVAPDTAPARSYPPRRFAGQHNAVRGRLR